MRMEYHKLSDGNPEDIGFSSTAPASIMCENDECMKKDLSQNTRNLDREKQQVCLLLRLWVDTEIPSNHILKQAQVEAVCITWETDQEQPQTYPSLKRSIRTITYPSPNPLDKRQESSQVAELQNHKSNSAVLLCHATLYILADCWLIDSLKTLALNKLHDTLCTFELDDASIEDVLDLARYAYTEGPGSGKEIGGLRNLVTQYIVRNSSEITPNSEFMELLDEGGQFVQDLWSCQVLISTHQLEEGDGDKREEENRLWPLVNAGATKSRKTHPKWRVSSFLKSYLYE